MILIAQVAPLQPVRPCKAADIWLHAALDKGERATNFRSLSPVDIGPCTQLIGGWVDPRNGLNAPVENRTMIPPCSNPWLSHGLKTAEVIRFYLQPE